MLRIDRSSRDMIYYDFLTSYFVRGGMTTVVETYRLLHLDENAQSVFKNFHKAFLILGHFPEFREKF